MDKSHLPQYEMCGWLTITRKNCFVSLIWMELFIFLLFSRKKITDHKEWLIHEKRKEGSKGQPQRDGIWFVIDTVKKIRRRVNRNNNREKSERPDVWMAHVSHTTLACPHSFFPDHSIIPELGFSGRSVGLAERVGWTLVTLEWGKTQTTHKKQLGMRNLGGTDGVKPGTREVNHHFFFGLQLLDAWSNQTIDWKREPNNARVCHEPNMTRACWCVHTLIQKTDNDNNVDKVKVSRPKLSETDNSNLSLSIRTCVPIDRYYWIQWKEA